MGIVEEECEGDLDNLEFGRWEDMEELVITIDSGAVDTVGPKGIAESFELKENEASRNKKCYRAANNSRIEIYGEKRIYGMTNDGRNIGMDMQIADVKKPLGSVRKICEAGNRVVFDEAGSYIEHKVSGNRTPIAKEGSVYTVSMWIPGSAPRRNSDFKRQARWS